MIESITPAAIEASDRHAGAGSRTRLFHGTRPLKRWRYVGIFCEELMACAALVQIGPARQSFWALHMREGGAMRERTRLLPRRAEVELLHGRTGADGRSADPGRLRVRDRGVALELRLDEDAGIEALCANGREQVWTRKQAGVSARGTIALDGGAPRTIEALAVIDDTAGYHTRTTEWRWSAGVGEAPDGSALAWNLVSGVNDPETGSERAVWVQGRPHEVGPVGFAEDLSRIDFDDGAELRFTAEAERSRHDNLLVLSSDYRAPFGTFSGGLSGGVELARGMGVMEHHRARW
ncbi:MAG: DUF2804 family protein [Solirubrobacteraceae bacterium]